MSARRVRIIGRVQGVGFRAWTVREARLLGLRGWVRNLTDGSVEALLLGDDQLIEKMTDLMRSGPRLAQVHDVQVLNCNVQIEDEQPGFRIMPE